MAETSEAPPIGGGEDVVSPAFDVNLSPSQRSRCKRGSTRWGFPSPLPFRGSVVSMTSGDSTSVTDNSRFDAAGFRANFQARVLGNNLSQSSSFIKVEDARDPEFRSRGLMLKVMDSIWMETVIGIVIVLNFVLICMETDSRALYPGSASQEPSGWVTDMQGACFVFFCLELAGKLYCHGREFHKKFWNLMDACIVAAGTVEYIVVLCGFDFGAVSLIRVVRLCRLLRLMRVIKLFAALKELRRLLQMMGSCFKTLFWSFLLLALVQTIWAIIAVEMVNPVIQRIADAGAWPECERCRRSFASVFMANVTFFKTVVAGDGWGYIAVPVIEAEPATAIVFIGSLLTLVFGVLNLIVAVIVDTFADHREKDVLSRAKEMDEQEKEQKKVLARIFQEVDTDRSGALSYDELVEGAGRVAEFSRWLRVLDIDMRDLGQLFKIVDEDNSGEIDPDEFIEAMYRIKTSDSRTATKFVKHIVMRLETRQNFLESQLLKTLPDVVNIDKRVRERLKHHEKRMQHTVEIAMQRAVDVMLESALHASKDTGSSIEDKVTRTLPVPRSPLLQDSPCSELSWRPEVRSDGASPKPAVAMRRLPKASSVDFSLPEDQRTEAMARRPPALLPRLSSDRSARGSAGASACCVHDSTQPPQPLDPRLAGDWSDTSSSRSV